MKLEQAAREVIRQHSMECLSDKTVDALREALAEPKKPEECENGCPPLQVCDYCQRAEQATVSDGLCGGCAKKAADGWALYCVECWEQAEQEPVAWIDLTKEELHQIEMNCETSAECYRVIAKALKDRNSAAIVHQAEQEHKCKDHPDAPHGFCRDASLSYDRYVCECEFWEPKENKIYTQAEIEAAVLAERDKALEAARTVGGEFFVEFEKVYLK